MKTLLCRVLAVTFLFNVLTPDARLFAQAKKGVPVFNLTGADINYSPETDERIAKSALANIKQYDPATNSYKNWNPSFVDEANLRLFLHNAPDAAFLDYISNNKLPADTWTVGMNEYVPGLNLQHNSDKVYSVVLRRLNLMLEQKELSLYDFQDLLNAPSDEIASYGALAMNMWLQMYDAQAINLFKEFFPGWQQTILKRLDAVQTEKNDSAVLPGRSLLEGAYKEQYRPVESIALRGNLHILLATMRDGFRKTESMPSPDPYKEPVRDPIPAQKYKELSDSVLQSVDYARTHKEWWMGSNAARLLNAEYAAMNLIAYDGIAGFERLVDFYESQNKVTKFQAESPTSFNLKKVSVPKQSVINTANFTQMQRAFSAMTDKYGPQVADRQQAMDPKELARLKNVLLKYANNGSAAARVLALATLADFYAKTGAKWTNRGYDKGAKSGLFLTAKAANQVADIIKEKYYCPLVTSPKSGAFGFNAQEMLKMTQMLADAYNGIRQDPQSYVVQKGQQAPCYVSLKPTLNRSAQADDLTDDAMWFVISWWGIGAAFKAVSGGAQTAANIARAAKTAAKAPARLQLSAFKASLKEAKDASKLARELAKNGITVERSYIYGAANGGKTSGTRQAVQNMTKTRVPHPTKELTTGYRVTQRLPGGKVITADLEAAQNTGRLLLSDGKTALGAPNGPFAQFFSIAGEAAAALPKAGPQLAAYRSLIATEDVMQAGLRTLAAQNTATGYGMFQKLVPDAAGKLTVENTPVFLRLSATDPLAHYNSAGQLIIGNVRADLLPAMERPGAVLSAALQEPARAGINYLKWITGISARFYAYDLLSQPVVSRWEDRDYNRAVARQTEGLTEEEMTGKDGRSLFRPEKSYSDYFMDSASDSGFTGAFFSLIGQGISRASASAFKWLFLPQVSRQERGALLEKNPYMKMYREKMQQWEKEYELQRLAEEVLNEQANYEAASDIIREDRELQEEEKKIPYQDLDEKGNLITLTEEEFYKRYPNGTALIYDYDEQGKSYLRTHAAHKKIHPEDNLAQPATGAPTEEYDEYTDLEDYY